MNEKKHGHEYTDEEQLKERLGDCKSKRDL